MITTNIYHGTPHNIESLCVAKAVDNNRHEFYGAAIYFSSNIDVAAGYSNAVKPRIFEVCVNESEFVILDGKYGVIRKLTAEIEQLVLARKNIIVRNVCDNNIFGSQSHIIDFTAASCSTYKYVTGYGLYQTYKKITPELQSMINAAKEESIELEVFNGNICPMRNLSYQQADFLHKIGFDIKKVVSAAPEFADTYIITDQDLLNNAKLIVG